MCVKGFQAHAHVTVIYKGKKLGQYKQEIVGVYGERKESALLRGLCEAPTSSGAS